MSRCSFFDEKDNCYNSNNKCDKFDEGKQPKSDRSHVVL